MRDEQYEPLKIEKKWQQVWADQNKFKPKHYGFPEQIMQELLHNYLLKKNYLLKAQVKSYSAETNLLMRYGSGKRHLVRIFQIK